MQRQRSKARCGRGCRPPTIVTPPQRQDLARNSQVTLSLRTGGPTGAARSWLLTAASPPQMLDVAVEGVAFSRVLALVAAALVGIVLTAGVLWRLL